MDDSGSGAKEDLNCVIPASSVIVGSLTFNKFLGQTPLKQYAPNGTFTAVAICLDSDNSPGNDLKEVKGGDWEQLWTDAGSGKNTDYSCWQVRNMSTSSFSLPGLWS